MELLGYILIISVIFLELNFVKGQQPGSNTTFDVTKFGALGDGTTNDAKAFESAWEAACNGSSESDTSVIVPNENTFLVSPIKFLGPCRSTNITFQILGTIVAQAKEDWESVDVAQWLLFQSIEGLSVVGNEQGVIDGRGDTWWVKGEENNSPTALRFSNCSKLEIKELKHKDPQRNHISINGCKNADISNLQITSPETSPNTDGIDISSSSNISIHDCIMQTGDDCIAINAGTSSLNISKITCGPGHGISVGSLGKDGKREEAQDIHVDNCTFVKTQNGVRIKTWQGGSGFAKNITFSNIMLISADNPIVIDQYYCPHQTCDDNESAVEISDVKYIGVNGTSSRSNGTINFSCSKTVPCTGIVVKDVEIVSDSPEKVASAFCSNAHGTSDHVIPPVDCLQP